jgi:tRNA-specific 2-thiouridylase
MSAVKKPVVFVAMSGGVDSSLTAALLVREGYDATGVYMKNWTLDLPGHICPWEDDFKDAKRVAVKLGIDFKVFDFQRQYRQRVVDYMISEYKAGRTPNPDVMCNQEIKFKLFLDTALENGADLIATGHYSRVKNGELHVAKDKVKDQSYFLYRVSEEALSKTLFPIGELRSKEDVRQLAKKFGLPTAGKKDSQGICFVGEVGIKNFLSQFVKAKPGPIVDQSGKEIGEHDGAIFYTIGQRHGLDVGGGLPYYVTKKDMKTNKVYVTTDLDDKELWSKQITLENLHWIDPSPKPQALNPSLKVRLRYRGPLVKCKITKNRLVLAEPQRAIAPGQSAVIYDGPRVLGGGIVSRA